MSSKAAQYTNKDPHFLQNSAMYRITGLYIQNHEKIQAEINDHIRILIDKLSTETQHVSLSEKAAS